MLRHLLVVFGLVCYSNALVVMPIAAKAPVGRAALPTLLFGFGGNKPENSRDADLARRQDKVSMPSPLTDY